MISLAAQQSYQQALYNNIEESKAIANECCALLGQIDQTIVNSYLEPHRVANIDIQLENDLKMRAGNKDITRYTGTGRMLCNLFSKKNKRRSDWPAVMCFEIRFLDYRRVNKENYKNINAKTPAGQALQKKKRYELNKYDEVPSKNSNMVDLMGNVKQRNAYLFQFPYKELKRHSKKFEFVLIQQLLADLKPLLRRYRGLVHRYTYMRQEYEDLVKDMIVHAGLSVGNTSRLSVTNAVDILGEHYPVLDLGQNTQWPEFVPSLKKFEQEKE